MEFPTPPARRVSRPSGSVSAPDVDPGFSQNSMKVSSLKKMIVELKYVIGPENLLSGTIAQIQNVGLPVRHSKVKDSILRGHCTARVYQSFLNSRLL